MVDPKPAMCPCFPEPGSNAVTVDDVLLSNLHEKTRIEVTTADDWTLVITRYKPVAQRFPQPIFGQPILLVHGFAQNRRVWTTGDFVKSMLFFGADVFVMDLRGHGKSSRSLQKRRAQSLGKSPPADIDWGWNLDSYFLFDLPAVVAEVRRVSGRDKIFYCGHSMGGILGYGYAGLHPDQIEGLITIGAPSDFVGLGFFFLGLVSNFQPALPTVDIALWGANLVRGAFWRGATFFREALGKELSTKRPEELKFEFVPTDIMEKATNALFNSKLYSDLTRIAPNLAFLLNPERTVAEDIRWLLREASDREPRGVVEQFAKWIRNNEMVCYQTGYDYKRGFEKISCPSAIIFGDRDWLAGVRATRSVYYKAKSQYLLWRPVKGNSHVELTMGHDIRQVCYDIKNLIEYAMAHRQSDSPLLRTAEP